MNVVIYARYSSHSQTEQSIEGQLQTCYEYARSHNYIVIGEYIDRAQSGTTDSRAEFQRMIADIESKKVNMVITKDLSRLGRDYIMTGHYMERYFPEKRVRYISLLDGVDTGVESSANDITPFRAIMNDMYAKDISKKIKSVKHDKQRKGEFIGGKPMYGYRMHPSEKNRIVIDEDAAPVVRRIFAMALAGTSCRQIAVRLNEEGVLSPAAYAGLTLSCHGPYSGQWSSERITAMLKNETYIGNMVQGRTARISYKTKKCLRRQPQQWVVVEHTHEPLIDPETFRKVQLMVNSRRNTRSRTYDFLLKGLIFCHECGYPLAVMNRRNAAGEDRLFFVCRTYQRFTKAGVCSCHSIKEQTVTEAVIERTRNVCETYLNPERLRPIAAAAVAASGRVDGREEELSALHARIDSMTAHLDRMYMDRLNGLLADVDFERLYRRIKAERTALEEKLRELEAQKKTPVPIEDRARELVQQFLHCAFTSRELLVSLIERIELTESKEIIIRFRFREPEAIF